MNWTSSAGISPSLSSPTKIPTSPCLKSRTPPISILTSLSNKKINSGIFTNSIKRLNINSKTEPMSKSSAKNKKFSSPNFSKNLNFYSMKTIFSKNKNIADTVNDLSMASFNSPKLQPKTPRNNHNKNKISTSILKESNVFNFKNRYFIPKTRLILPTKREKFGLHLVSWWWSLVFICMDSGARKGTKTLAFRKSKAKRLLTCTKAKTTLEWVIISMLKFSINPKAIQRKNKKNMIFSRRYAFFMRNSKR